MELQVKKLTENEWKSYAISRYMLSDYINCYLAGGYQDATPQRGQLYNLRIVDSDTGTRIEKLGIFMNYNYVVDKDGDSVPVICDNSLNFQVAE